MIFEPMSTSKPTAFTTQGGRDSNDLLLFWEEQGREERNKYLLSIFLCDQYVLAGIVLTLDLLHHTASMKLMYMEVLEIGLHTLKYVFQLSGYYLFNLDLQLDIFKAIWIPN